MYSSIEVLKTTEIIDRIFRESYGDEKSFFSKKMLNIIKIVEI